MTGWGSRMGQGVYITLTLGLTLGIIFPSILTWELRRSEQQWDCEKLCSWDKTSWCIILGWEAVVYVILLKRTKERTQPITNRVGSPLGNGARKATGTE